MISFEIFSEAKATVKLYGVVCSSMGYEGERRTATRDVFHGNAEEGVHRSSLNSVMRFENQI